MIRLAEDKIQRIEEAGAKRWTRYGNDRLYLRGIEKLIGLEYKKYNTGNIKSASLQGDEISNSRCYRILGTLDKGYYDIQRDVYVLAGRAEDIRVIKEAIEELIKKED